MKSSMPIVLCLGILLIVALSGYVGFRLGKDKCADPANVSELLMEQGRLQASIAERDSTIAQYDRQLKQIELERSERKPPSTRIRDAETRLRPASADSLLRVLDRPIADPR